LSEYQNSGIIVNEFYIAVRSVVVRAMLLMGVAYIFFTTTLLLVDLQLNSINQHQVSIMKCVLQL